MPRALVHVTLPLPAGDLPVVAEVDSTNVPGNLVRRNLPIGMAVCWSGLEAEEQERLQAFVDDPEYAPHAEARQNGSVSNFYAIDDTDIAGTIPYLPKG